MATITAMLLTFVLAPWFIRELQKKQIGQIVRSSGPETHKIKAGTPTMGGALILLSLLLPTVLWADLRNPFVLATTAVTAGYGVIGYLDDYLKSAQENRGLPGATSSWVSPVAGAVSRYVRRLPPIGLPGPRPAVPLLAFRCPPAALAYIVRGLHVVATSNAVT
jgi:phospho-N-acetylmuramoyl-pentapeptide-transferase